MNDKELIEMAIAGYMARISALQAMLRGYLQVQAPNRKTRKTRQATRERMAKAQRARWARTRNTKKTGRAGK